MAQEKMRKLDLLVGFGFLVAFWELLNEGVEMFTVWVLLGCIAWLVVAIYERYLMSEK